MNHEIPGGVWPTMMTPFTEKNEVDYGALGAMTEWYIEQGVDGLFAVCQSSEMYTLTLQERVKIAKFVKDKSGNKVSVIASGHVSDSMNDQVAELQAMADTGIDALVWVSNHLALQNESDEIWKRNADRLMEAVPDIPLGIYECPQPYKRLVSPELLRWCADTGRFLFLKDTCCDLEQLKRKSEAVKNSRLKIFNANAATLLGSLKLGIAGFSGIMANFHPSLYVWLTRNWRKEPEKAAALQDFLGVASLIEGQYYPVNGKYHMQLNGIPVQLFSRVRDANGFMPHQRIQVEQLYELTKKVKEKIDEK